MFINKIRNFFTPTGYIILYHRVADAKHDPHLLCVSPKNFREQIKFFKENFRAMPLGQLVWEVRSKKLKNKSVAITFDDGYADNLHDALPILKEYNIPATIFLTAGYVGQDKPFYWDENTPPEDRGRPVTPDEAKMLSKSHIVEIGSHTISHSKLAKLSETDQFNEIAGGKKMLEQALNMHLLSFAYPFGDKDSFDKKTVNLVKKAGFHYACANIHKRVTNQSNLYALPRFIARNWNKEELKRHIKTWL